MLFPDPPLTILYLNIHMLCKQFIGQITKFSPWYLVMQLALQYNYNTVHHNLQLQSLQRDNRRSETPLSIHWRYSSQCALRVTGVSAARSLSFASHCRCCHSQVTLSGTGRPSDTESYLNIFNFHNQRLGEWV